MNKRAVIYTLLLMLIVALILFIKCTSVDISVYKNLLIKNKKYVKEMPEHDFKKKMIYSVSEKKSRKKIREYDIYLLKLDNLGSVVWERTFDIGGFDWGEVIEESESGDFIISGKSYNAEAQVDTNFILSVDSQGNSKWVKTLGDTGIDIKTKDGGSISTGRSYGGDENRKSLFIAKSDKKGNYKWIKTFSESFIEWGYFAFVTDDGSYITTGQVENNIPQTGDLFLMKRGEHGKMEWSKAFGGDYYDWGYSVIKSGLDEYFAVGLSSSYGEGDNDVFMVKVDSQGNCLLAKTFGYDGDDDAYAVAGCGDGNFVIAGSTDSFGNGGFDALVVKVDAMGNCLWAKSYGKTGDESMFSIVGLSEGGFIMAGTTDSQ